METDYFDIVTGVLQGDALAPYLFIICLDYSLSVMFWPFDPAKNVIQGGAPEGSDTSRSLEIGRGCVGVEACLYYCVGVWR